MSDFRLKVFQSVAKNLSFTKASQELFVSQPAITKHIQELEARIRSLTRRKFVQKDICLHCKDIKFDTKKREAYAKGILVPLTRKENGILEYLLLNQGRPVSQEELIEHVWDASIDSFSGSIRVHMSSLRKKFKSVLGYDPIVNKIGEGYKLVEGVS